MDINELYCGDNLAIMRKMQDESVDLIYLDPPFFSQVDYKDFDDRFENMDGYIDWMVPRLKEMYRILKPIGSIYLHCDWHASAYLKIEMDDIFGIKNFQNEIIWHYFMGGKAKKFFARKHDNILVYAKGRIHTFNPMKHKRRLDFKPSLKNDAKNADTGKDEFGYYSVVTMDDVWDIKSVFNMSNEYEGYPTQKPLALLDRIIKASSNEGDIVFDPFCGCGTAPAGAKKLGRKYIGIDINPDAIDLTRQRLAQIITYGSINERWVKRAQPAVTVNVGQTNQNTVNIR